ncbi:hypothetical protein AYO20_08056 [Fonsecaea nubica]|uniref:4Fe-4S ferredoxin-type domain-containing protein n=1 Tax=Fonsecaea nubica TaxID=856822 RepID=A0A178CQK6_9EURO|nr:hypothetical protein AYO20_08056 [Fonsecaea nubica]OAL32118.1 hypothetical protein AYO20_08056 [Fonsecaea nubica]
MRARKRSGEEIATPISPKIPRCSTNTTKDALLSRPDPSIPISHEPRTDLSSTQSSESEFYVRITLCSETKALTNDPIRCIKCVEKPLGIEYLDPKVAAHDEFAHIHWLEPMEVTVTRVPSSPGGCAERAGFCGAKLIRRLNINREFYKEMSKPFDESTLLAFDLFDRFGNPKQDGKNPFLSEELFMLGIEPRHGDILLIEDLIVEKPYRRMGLSKLIVSALLEATEQKTHYPFAAILWPEPSKHAHFHDSLAAIVGDSGNEHRPEVFDHYDAEAVAWADSLGFHRIGSSIWFGRASQPKSLMMREDPYHPPTFVRPIKDALPKSILGELNDVGFLEAAQQYLQQTMPDDQRWFATDKEANTLLHLAALRFLPKSVAWMMQQPASAQLITTSNSSGNTPLDALLEKLEIVRTRSWSGTTINIVSNDFQGYTDSMAKCVALLKGAEIESDQDLIQFRYGCTCGKCIHGYLSPRMISALLHAATGQYPMLMPNLENLSGIDWVRLHKDVTRRLPFRCLKPLRCYKSVRRGCVELYNNICKCLAAGRAPIVDSILGTKDDKTACIEKFFMCGGNITGLISLIFRRAFLTDKFCGDGVELPEGDGYLYSETECCNDHEFALVARKCGYESVAEALKETEVSRYPSWYTGWRGSIECDADGCERCDICGNRCASDCTESAPSDSEDTDIDDMDLDTDDMDLNVSSTLPTGGY